VKRYFCLSTEQLLRSQKDFALPKRAFHSPYGSINPTLLLRQTHASTHDSTHSILILVKVLSRTSSVIFRNEVFFDMLIQSKKLPALQ
jgi:hypothetical protein